MRLGHGKGWRRVGGRLSAPSCAHTGSRGASATRPKLRRRRMAPRVCGERNPQKTRPMGCSFSHSHWPQGPLLGRVCLAHRPEGAQPPQGPLSGLRSRPASLQRDLNTPGRVQHSAHASNTVHASYTAHMSPTQLGGAFLCPNPAAGSQQDPLGPHPLSFGPPLSDRPTPLTFALSTPPAPLPHPPESPSPDARTGPAVSGQALRRPPPPRTPFLLPSLPQPICFTVLVIFAPSASLPAQG